MGGAIFFSFGAYSSALLNRFLGLPPIVSILSAIIFTSLLSFLMGYPLLRKLKQDYFALVTLALSLLFQVLYRSFAPGGNAGIAGIESLIPISISGILYQVSYLAVIIGFVIFSFVLMLWINRTRLGLLFDASRIDENTVQVLGYSPLKIRLQAFVLSGFLGGAAGAMQAHYIGAVDPGLSSLTQTILILSGTIIAGRKSIVGSFIGAFFIIIIPEIIQKLLSIQFTSNWQIFPSIQVIYGILIIIISFSVFRQKKTYLQTQIGNLN